MSLYAIIIIEHWLPRLVPQLLLGAAFCHGVELQHQALHYTGFRSAWANRLAGLVVGFPMLVPFSAYRDRHLFHHQALGRPDDEEFFQFQGFGSSRWWHLFKSLFMLSYYYSLCKHFIDTMLFRPYTVKSRGGDAAKIRHEYFLVGGVFFGLAGWSLFTGSGIFLQCWLIPLFCFATPIHALVELPEHYGCNTRSLNVFENTRTIYTHPFFSWFTNGNNYHVEHHYLPKLPMEQLRDIHPQIKDKICYHCPSYFAFYRKLARDFIAGKPK